MEFYQKLLYSHPVKTDSKISRIPSNRHRVECAQTRTSKCPEWHDAVPNRHWLIAVRFGSMHQRLLFAPLMTSCKKGRYLLSIFPLCLNDCILVCIWSHFGWENLVFNKNCNFFNYNYLYLHNACLYLTKYDKYLYLCN